MTDDTARRERAEKWSETHCASCGMPKATEEDWLRCDNGCECDLCKAVCWEEYNCNEDDAAVVCYLAGAREEAEVKDAEIAALRQNLTFETNRLNALWGGEKFLRERDQAEIAALREAVKDFLCECALVDKFRRYETWQITPWSMDELMKMVEEEP